MPRKLGAGALAATAALCVTAPAARASDVAATQAYVAANYALLRSAGAHLRAAEAAPRKLLARLRRACPGAARGSPQNGQSTQLSNEVIGAMVIAAYRVDLPAIRRFVASVRGLRFSRRALGRAVRSYAGSLRVLAGLAPPSLCADVRAWAAGGFTALPAATVRFDRLFMPNWVTIGMLPRGLARYESAAARSLAGRGAKIELRITDAEAAAVETWGKIIDELGIWP
jgi:hypothetical protein